jgi:GNAT superfamily N-acetyltransferase
MCDEWMQVIQLPLTLEQFHQLPRHPAYKYEYLGGQAYLAPRPKFYHAVLDLEHFPSVTPVPRGITIRALEETDVGNLEHVFAVAFDRQQPFSGLERDVRLQAARQALEKTRSGGDGPLIRQASFVAQEDMKPVGAIFVTLLPDADPDDWDGFRWQEPPPADCVERRLGRPHVTWVFVRSWSTGHGTGTALLGAAVTALRGLGYAKLASTFLVGNESSMLWHWRNGFALQPHPGSRRNWEKMRVP